MYSISIVSKITGLNPSTLRSWERRYGLPKPNRSGNGRRQYSEEDVQKLKLISRLSSLGHSVNQLFRSDVGELEKLLASNENTIPDPLHRQEYRERLFRAARQLNFNEFRLILSEAIAVLPPAMAADIVIAPLLREIGDAWLAGDVPIFVEHVTSSLIKLAIFSAAGPAAWRKDGPIALFGSIQGEHHELGAMLAWYMAALSGWHAIYLGPNVPVSEFALAANKLGAKAIGLSLLRPYENDRDIQQVSDLALLTRCSLWLGTQESSRFLPLMEKMGERMSVFTNFQTFDRVLSQLTTTD